MARMFTEDEARELIEAAMAPLLTRIVELEASATTVRSSSTIWCNSWLLAAMSSVES